MVHITKFKDPEKLTLIEKVIAGVFIFIFFVIYVGVAFGAVAIAAWIVKKVWLM